MKLAVQDGFRNYIMEIKKFPFLTEQQEMTLAKQFKEEGDIKAAERLVTSHLLFVVKIAKQFFRYGLPIGELISEGNIGLMKAVQRFDYTKGFRFATYAFWWVKAEIYQFILKSWSSANINLNSPQRKLFFNLRKYKNKWDLQDNQILPPEKIIELAKLLNVSEKDVKEIDEIMISKDLRLDSFTGDESDETWKDLLVDESDSQETKLIESQYNKSRKTLLEKALQTLNPREQIILKERKLKEDPVSLQELSISLKISRERVRQIESRAFEKLQEEVLRNAYV